MNDKGQSALEYLMTYGWALVVIVIVIGALALLLPDMTGATETCTGMPSQFVYDSHLYESDGTFSVKFTNGQLNDINVSALRLSDNNSDDISISPETKIDAGELGDANVSGLASHTAGSSYGVDVVMTYDVLNSDGTAKWTGRVARFKCLGRYE